MVLAARLSRDVALDHERIELERPRTRCRFVVVPSHGDPWYLMTPGEEDALAHLTLLEEAMVLHEECPRLIRRLRAMFEAEPIEDGMNHPAEEVIDEALMSQHSDITLKALRDLVLDHRYPSSSASALRCLGRLSNAGNPQWRVSLVRDALMARDAEMRDAAVQAAESWADQDFIEVLSQHQDEEAWLQDYVLAVIRDLRE